MAIIRISPFEKLWNVNLGYHWEKEKHPENNEVLTDHTYGTCVHKIFSAVNERLQTEYDEHQESVINFKNNETELNDELMANFTKQFESNISGIIQTKHFRKHTVCDIRYVASHLIIFS